MISPIELGCSIAFDVNSMKVTSADSEQMMAMIITCLNLQARNLNCLGEFSNDILNSMHLLTKTPFSKDIAACFDNCIEKLFRTMDRHLRRGLPVHVSP